MSFNTSRESLPYGWCFLMFPNVSESSATFYHVTLAAAVVAAILAPLAVAGNALILAAIWRNQSLRTPSYLLLAGLAVTDFFTGLLSQPFFVVYKLANLAENRGLYCIAALVTESTVIYFCSITVVTIMMIALERWLHMSRRSLLTVPRVVICFVSYAVLLIIIVVVRMFTLYYSKEAFNALESFNYFAATLCVVATAFAYFKVFQIIRHHQNQVQPYQRALDMEKYKKSIFTILYIVAIFLLSYVPFLCSMLVFQIGQSKGISYRAAINACIAVVFSSSFLNPLLYCWRIKEIRDSVQIQVRMIRKLPCEKDGEGSQ